VRNPARDAPDNELDDDCSMDEDERLDYADQQPLHLPTPTGVLGPMAQFLSDMPDFLEGIEESLQRALDALPIPTPGPPPDGINMLEAFQVSSVNRTCPL
jgi:hypothetical protein